MKDLRDVNRGPDQVAASGRSGLDACLQMTAPGSCLCVYFWGSVCESQMDALTLYTLEEAARNSYDIYVLRWVGVVVKRRRRLISALVQMSPGVRLLKTGRLSRSHNQLIIDFFIIPTLLVDLSKALKHTVISLFISYSE